MDEVSALRPVIVFLLCCLAAGILSAGTDLPLQQRLDRLLQPYVQNGGIMVALGEGVLYSHQGSDTFIPASTLKLATALAAMHYLGRGYRFKTEFYLNSSHDLTIRGYGDPLLISEEWKEIIEQMMVSGKLPEIIGHLCLDPSAFSGDLQIPGVRGSQEPYDALNSALAVNFNTIHVEVATDGAVLSSEPQTPVTPLARRLARDLPPGKHRINISGKRENILLYTGELVQGLLEQRGCLVAGGIRVRPVSGDDRLVHTHLNSHSLEQVIQSMMLYSNNFIANQLLLVIGLEKKGEPATLEKGLSLLKLFLTNTLGIPQEAFHIVEGSGISRENRMRPDALIVLVRAFYPFRTLLPVLDGSFVKTGTLKGVYSLVGYPDPGQPLFCAIMLNQKRNHRRKVYDLLCREVE